MSKNDRAIQIRKKFSTTKGLDDNDFGDDYFNEFEDFKVDSFTKEGTSHKGKGHGNYVDNKCNRVRDKRHKQQRDNLYFEK